MGVLFNCEKLDSLDTFDPKHTGADRENVNFRVVQCSGLCIYHFKGESVSYKVLMNVMPGP